MWSRCIQWSAAILALVGALATAVSADSAMPSAAVESSGAGPAADGPFRTMCVRACDGYYFPIRTYARRANFEADAKTCRTSCGVDATLYYHPTFGGAPAMMVDLGGRRYGDQPNAFAFRKNVTAACSCKPPAWSETELARHREYARLEAIELAKDRAFVAAQQAAKPIAAAKPNTADWQSAMRAATPAVAPPAERAPEPAPRPMVVTAPAAFDELEAIAAIRRRGRIGFGRPIVAAPRPLAYAERIFVRRPKATESASW